MFVVSLGKSRCASFSFSVIWKNCGQGFDILLFAVLLPEIAPHVFIGEGPRGYGLVDPRDVDEVAPVDVFRGAVAAPGAATEGGGGGHTVEGSWTGAR